MLNKSALFALLGMSMMAGTSRGRDFEPSPPAKPVTPKGAQEYYFGGVRVVARTYERAVEKAKKRGLI